MLHGYCSDVAIISDLWFLRIIPKRWGNALLMLKEKKESRDWWFWGPAGSLMLRYVRDLLLRYRLISLLSLGKFVPSIFTGLQTTPIRNLVSAARYYSCYAMIHQLVYDRTLWWCALPRLRWVCGRVNGSGDWPLSLRICRKRSIPYWGRHCDYFA